MAATRAPERPSIVRAVPPASSPRDRFLKGTRSPQLKHLAMIGHEEHFAASCEPVDWAMEGVLQRQHLALVAGPSGVCKTTFVALLLAAPARPSRCWGIA
jgi:AAA domain